MKRFLLLAVTAAFLPSCADESTRTVGPVSESSQIPWNTPIAGQGGGQFSMLPQNQQRR